MCIVETGGRRHDYLPLQATLESQCPNLGRLNLVKSTLMESTWPGHGGQRENFGPDASQ